jgi:uncharacterized circularly permuted ATP-grasp superfamily protein
MDDVVRRAADDYHALLRDEKGLRDELESNFFARMQQANLTFGGRTLCPFPRPNFVSPDVYRQIQGVCRRIFRAIEKAETSLGEGLFDRVGLTPEERELVAIPSGYRRSSPTSRLDSFLTTDAYRFVELNAETPAGIGYNEVLVEVFLELPIVKKFQERYSLRRFRARERVLETLLRCYREAGGKAAKPMIAVVDYEEVPTRTEHHMFREFFEANGCPSIVCDPRHLSFEGGRLRHDGRAIDIIYKRLLVNELLDRIGENQALVAAAKAGAVVIVNPFRCKPIHKKAIFAVLTEDELQPLFTEEEQAAIRAHVPWTRRVREGRATRQGQSLDLPAFILKNRDRLVMKPNDEYGGKGVFIGWETTDSEWAEALHTALGASYVVQERVELLRQTFPEMQPGEGGRGTLHFRDLVVDLDPFVFEGEVEGFLTRLSGTSLANVTSGGGQVPAFLVEPRA